MTPTREAAIVAAAENSKAWPFEEARRLVKRIARLDEPPAEVIFETGYGPSGLPHIGTFGEVARTSMVRAAFALLSDLPTRLVCFSDDLDGLRKVPDNVPEREMMMGYLDQPLTAVPDPFATHSSFGAHNNARLCAFLDQFGFDYDFYSSSELYRAGRFDETLLKMLEVLDEVMAIILPTIGPDRQKTYAPFLPISERTGKVLQVPIEEARTDAGTIVYRDPETADLVETPVTGGRVKCQWKADWAMRWAALGVDYEMAGKDLIDSVRLSSRICRVLGGTPPEGFNYELFLDENGEKISKSRGNGLTIDEWLTYASPESLSLFMFQKPRTAKRLHFDIIPKTVDEYLTHLSKFPDQDIDKQLANPVFHVHSGAPPSARVAISFNLLLNLVSASNAEDREVLWGFIRRYAPDADPAGDPLLDQLVGYAMRYYHDVVEPTKQYRPPNPVERAALAELRDKLGTASADATGEDLQAIVYEVGKGHDFANLRDWFRALYEVLFGQSQGPRFGSFIELYGVEETRAMIERALADGPETATK